MAEMERRVEAESGRPLPKPEPPGPIVSHGRFAEMWMPPYRNRTLMLTAFNIFQTVGFYGFANWVPTLLIKQGITVTNSLLYTALIALAAPVGPLIGLAIADRFERKHVIVAAALSALVFGLLFSQSFAVAEIVSLGVGLTLANNIRSYSFHTYQNELFPTGIRARAVGFVYSWSRSSAIFTAFLIAFTLDRFGTTGVFIAGAMLVVALLIGLMGPHAKPGARNDLALTTG